MFQDAFTLLNNKYLPPKLKWYFFNKKEIIFVAYESEMLDPMIIFLET